MATQAFDRPNESLPENHSAIEESDHGRHPHPHVHRDTEYREVNVDQLSESDFEGMKDSGLAYSDHDYIGSNPCSTHQIEMIQFPTLGGVTDQYLSGESSEPCLPETRPIVATSSSTAPASAMKKAQMSVTQFRPVKDLGLTQQPILPGRSVSWKSNVTQPKKSGRPQKNEAREMSGDRLMGRAMVKAGMQAQPHANQQIPSLVHHSQGVDPMHDLGRIDGAAPIVTPARGPKIMPRGRSASAIRRDTADDGNAGFSLMPIQQASTSYRAIAVSSPKKGQHVRSAQAAEEAHTREMMEAAQNALAPSNATISGHNVMISAQPLRHSIVLPVQPVHQASQHFDQGDLPRTPGKTFKYTPTTSPSTRRTISESQEMNMHLHQEPLRTNPDGLPVTPGGNRKIASRSGTPRSRMSISESTGSQGTSPRHFVPAPSKNTAAPGGSYSSPQRAMQPTLKSTHTVPIVALTQGPSTMASAQMQMSSNAPMPSLHNQGYHQPSFVARNLVTSPMGMSYYDASGAQAAPLITASGSNTYTPRRRKEKETDDAVEAEVNRNVKTIMQTEKTHRLSTTSSHDLSPINDTSEEDSAYRGGHERARENKKSSSKRIAQKQSKRAVTNWSKDESEEDAHEESSWLVRCICGQSDDDGEAMVACDSCIRWEHVDCIFPTTKTAPKGGYTCHTCAPRPTELTPTMARDYQDRVKRQKAEQMELELKRKLQERVAKRKEDSSRKPSSVSRSVPSKASKIEKPSNSNYRDLEKNEYSSCAKRFISISRASGSSVTTPEIIKILRDEPRAKKLVVEPNTYGLITKRAMNAGDYIAEICGHVCLPKDCLNRDAPPGSCNDQTFLIEKDGDKIIVDARKCGNYARYVRRSCKPNATLQEIMSGSELHVMIIAKDRIDEMSEVKIGLESDWTINYRSAQGCSCRGEELKTCQVQAHYHPKGKNMVPLSRRSLPANGATPKGAASPVGRSVTEKKKSGSGKKVIAKKGKKKGTIKLPRPARKSKGSASTADESEREDGAEEYEESTADEKEEKSRRRGRRNTGSTSEGKEKEMIKKEEESDMPILNPVPAPNRSSARIRNDSEVKKEVESPKKEESNEKRKTADKRDSMSDGSKKGGRKSVAEEKKAVKDEIKEEIKEEPMTPVQKKEKKPWPIMNYDLPSERNKPSREERKMKAEVDRIDKETKKKGGSSTRGRPPAATPVGVKKEEKTLTSGRGKRKADKEEESARADCNTAISSTPILPSMRKRGNIVDKSGEKESSSTTTASPAPSSSLSSMHSPHIEDGPAASPAHTGTKKQWLQRHNKEVKAAEEAAAAKTLSCTSTPSAPSVTSSTSTPTRSKRFNKKEEIGAVEALMNMGGVDEKRKKKKKGESIRDEMRRHAIKLASLQSTPFTIGNMRAKGDTLSTLPILSTPTTSTACPSAPFSQLPAIITCIGQSAGPSTPPLPVTPTPITPIESAKSVKTVSLNEYRKRKQTEGTLTGEDKKEESERKITPKKSFMPSADASDASASMSSLPNVKLPDLEETVGMDELSRRVYGDVSTRKREGASTSNTSTPIIGKTQPTPKRQSINDRLKNEFSMPILSTPPPLAVSTPSIPTATVRPPAISPNPIGSQPTTGSRPFKNRLSDARALNMDPPGMISTPQLSSIITPTNSGRALPSPSISSSATTASFIQRAGSIRSSQK